MSDILHTHFPLYKSKLNPNVALHWSKKLSSKRAAHREGFIVGKTLKSTFTKQDKLSLILIPHWSDHIHRDLDNLAASAKSLIDGLFLALKLNDSQIDEMRVIRGAIVDKPILRLYLKRFEGIPEYEADGEFPLSNNYFVV